MKVMICENCENTISEDYLETVVDVSVNEDGINTYYEHTQRCQCCGGIYVEAETCSVCGNYKRPTDLIEGVCEDCLEEFANFDTALKFGEDNRIDYEINGFIANLYRLNRDNKLAEKFCLEDEHRFAKFLRKELKNEKN